MPDFLRESTADNVEQIVADEEFSEKCALDESRIEVCRHQDTDIDSGLYSSLSPAHCLQQTAAFSDEDDIPSHENAERYFSCSDRAISPDFSDPKLMERSVRDIGMESPKSGSRTWTLIGNISDNPCSSLAKQSKDDFVFAVPSMPPLRLYHRRVSAPLLETAVNSNAQTQQCADPVHQSPSIDTSVVHNELSSSSTTPSPTTHDLVIVGGDCVVSNCNQVRSAVQHPLAPIVDSEDSDEEFGIV